MSLLRLVLMGEILRAEETVLVLLADLMQACGLLQLADEPAVTPVRPQKDTLHTPRRPEADHP